MKEKISAALGEYGIKHEKTEGGIRIAFDKANQLPLLSLQQTMTQPKWQPFFYPAIGRVLSKATKQDQGKTPVPHTFLAAIEALSLKATGSKIEGNPRISVSYKKLQNGAHIDVHLTP